MLRYLYTMEYIPNAFSSDSAVQPTWEEHLSAAIVGDKYGITDLRSHAFSKFEHCARRIVDSKEIIKLTQRQSECPDINGDLVKLVKKLIEDNFVAMFHEKEVRAIMDAEPERKYQLYLKHFPTLIEMPEFRSILEVDGKLALKFLDEFKAAELLVEKEILRCAHCGHIDSYDLGTGDSTSCKKPIENVFGKAKCGSWNLELIRKCWVKPSQDESNIT